MLQTHQKKSVSRASIPVGLRRGTVPGPLALQPLPDLLAASAAGLASGSACRARHALRQPPVPRTAQCEDNECFIKRACVLIGDAGKQG